MLGLDIAYMHAQFDHSSLSHSGDKVGAHQIKMVQVTWPCPFQGQFAIHGLALAKINLSTKFEVSISTHYEDTKGDTKQQKWGGLGLLGVTQGHWK